MGENIKVRDIKYKTCTEISETMSRDFQLPSKSSRFLFKIINKISIILPKPF